RLIVVVPDIARPGRAVTEVGGDSVVASARPVTAGVGTPRADVAAAGVLLGRSQTATDPIARDRHRGRDVLGVGLEHVAAAGEHAVGDRDGVSLVADAVAEDQRGLVAFVVEGRVLDDRGRAADVDVLAVGAVVGGVDDHVGVLDQVDAALPVV